MYDYLYNRLFVYGGFTVSAKLEVYEGDGYAVSFSGYEARIPRRLLSREVFAALLNSYRNIAGDLYIGGWVDGDTVYFDVSAVIPEKEKAIALARDNNQRAIYSFAKRESIYL
jgi:hypothetical protein